KNNTDGSEKTSVTTSDIAEGSDKKERDQISPIGGLSKTLDNKTVSDKPNTFFPALNKVESTTTYGNKIEEVNQVKIDSTEKTETTKSFEITSKNDKPYSFQSGTTGF